MKFYRPEVSRFTVVICSIIFIIGLCNFSFWQKAAEYTNSDMSILVGAAVVLFFLFCAALGSFAYPYLLKPIAIIFVLIAAVSSYFADAFGIIIDRQMITNVMETNSREAGDLITLGLVLKLSLLCLLPIALILWVKIKKQSFKKTYFQNLAFVLCSLAIALAIALPNFATIASLVRNHRDLAKRLHPSQPIAAMVKYAQSHIETVNVPMTQIGLDAKPNPNEVSAKPRLTVFIVGETARAHNFSLNGYEKETNPELKKQDIINFSNVSSCGTETAVSVPCMFSKFPRSDYSASTARRTENVIDIMDHGGVQVAWFDNNTGSKGQADRVFYESTTQLTDPKFCNENGCYDEIMLEEMKKFVAKMDDKDTFIVLHQLGSHGPAYFKRSPEQFKKFLPECSTSEINKCSQEEIINGYDNSILYTDFFISQVINYLKSQEDKYNTSMIYVSDHGESTGENGVYLHGLPYFIAPEFQTHVPMVLWMSDDAMKAKKLDKACLEAISKEEYSHDNMFHTLLNLTAIETKEYDEDLDIIAKCK